MSLTPEDVQAWVAAHKGRLMMQRSSLTGEPLYTTIVGDWVPGTYDFIDADTGGRVALDHPSLWEPVPLPTEEPAAVRATQIIASEGYLIALGEDGNVYTTTLARPSKWKKRVIGARNEDK